MSKLASRLLGAALMAAVAATAFFTTEAQANLPPWGKGVVLVAPSSKVGRPALRQEQAAPGFKRGKIVAFTGNYAPGSIIVITGEHALYYVLGGGKAVKYRVATGKKGFEWSGRHAVSSKVKWPEWNPPAEMRVRRPELPLHMAGGPQNPLGARAIYLGSSLYRIHGTNEPASIGKSASSGCIRMLNQDVIELFNNVKIGATVVVI
jgi:lipoprotein-anchoring transpeptidase ErfK/SrfK